MSLGARGVVVTAMCLLAAKAAAADTCSPFASAGGSLSATEHGSDSGRGLGGELSAGCILPTSRESSSWSPADLVWLGGYIDAVYDTLPHKTRMSLGPEIGYGLLGIDGGVVEQLDGPRTGVVGRIVLTGSLLGFYARYDQFLDRKPDDGVLEVGVLLKIPHLFKH
jgi:hypothetical protein